MGRKNQTEVIEAPEATEERKVSRRQEWREKTTVTLTEKGAKNPKKPNSMSYDRYEVLLAACNGSKEAPTVAALFKAGYRMDDIRHDVAHGHITINEPFAI